MKRVIVVSNSQTRKMKFANVALVREHFVLSLLSRGSMRFVYMFDILLEQHDAFLFTTFLSSGRLLYVPGFIIGLSFLCFRFLRASQLF